MTMGLRRAAERGSFDFGWLQTAHTFSFGDYHDPNHMGFRVLRVINEDSVSPAQGFGTHAHRDMEIITYVTRGALEHKDSMGNGSIIRPGDVQYMSAGSGVTHSEFNHSQTEPVHLLQIWIRPNESAATPRYNQKSFSTDQKQNRLCLLASPDGREGSIEIRQDAMLFATILPAGTSLSLPLSGQRFGWIQVVSGSGSIDDLRIATSDGVSLAQQNGALLTASAVEPLEILFFDLP